MPDCVSSVKKVKRRPSLAEDSGRQLLIPLLTALFIIIVDQLSKVWALGYLADNHMRQILGSFFQIKIVYNQGGALGTNFGSSIFYLISSILILLIVIYFILNNKNNLWLTIPMAGIAGGAVGNIIDRIRLGHVIDFLDFDFFNFNFFGRPIDRWWTFNIADAAITVSVIFLIIYVMFFSHKKPPQENPTAQ